MSKVVVTGHSSGIGKAIFDYFSNDPNNQVFGFSRANGHDIKDWQVRNKILEFSLDADIFVNNAHSRIGYSHNDSQLILLRKMFHLWEGQQNKLIINVSSIAPANEVQDGYSLLKSGLDSFCRSKTYKWPHIINLKPNWVMVENLRNHIGEQPHMTTDQLVDILDFCLKSPISINEITLQKR